MSNRDQVLAYRDALKAAGASEIRMPMTDDTAIALARELGPSELRYADKLTHALAEIDRLDAIDEPQEFNARLDHLQGKAKARSAFWDAFEGQDVAGVEIIRRR